MYIVIFSNIVNSQETHLMMQLWSVLSIYGSSGSVTACSEIRMSGIAAPILLVQNFFTIKFNLSSGCFLISHYNNNGYTACIALSSLSFSACNLMAYSFPSCAWKSLFMIPIFHYLRFLLSSCLQSLLDFVDLERVFKKCNLIVWSCLLKCQQTACIVHFLPLSNVKWLCYLSIQCISSCKFAQGTIHY